MFRKILSILSFCVFFSFSAFSSEKTFSMIKPNALKFAAEIQEIMQENGLKIIEQKQITLTRKQASKFYAEHEGKKFFIDLIDFMISGPVIVQILEGKNAIAKNRELMGNTDPKLAKKDTIRAKFGEDITKNAIHGSDSAESAAREIKFFFN